VAFTEEIMTHCRICGVLDDVGEVVICEDCADKIDTDRQCHTCKLKGRRSCTYHGYPSSEIPTDSCTYKVGIDSEEALKNLNGTHIDVWTKEHDIEVNERVLSSLFNYIHPDSQAGKVIQRRIDLLRSKK
jgi:hypothetical protein